MLKPSPNFGQNLIKSSQCVFRNSRTDYTMYFTWYRAPGSLSDRWSSLATIYPLRFHEIFVTICQIFLNLSETADAKLLRSRKYFHRYVSESLSLIFGFNQLKLARFQAAAKKRSGSIANVFNGKSWDISRVAMI